MKSIIIAAVDEEFGIGKNNSIPWYCPDDMKFFKSVTMGNTVVMGRNTWESLKKLPLSKRKNIVITSSTNYYEGEFDKLNEVTLCNFDVFYQEMFDSSVGDVFTIGGAMLYEKVLELRKGFWVDEIWLNEIPGKFNCDRFFPKDQLENFNLLCTVKFQTFTFKKYINKRNVQWE